jgi:hypothetical protein
VTTTEAPAPLTEVELADLAARRLVAAHDLAETARADARAKAGAEATEVERRSYGDEHPGWQAPMVAAAQAREVERARLAPILEAEERTRREAEARGREMFGQIRELRQAVHSLHSDLAKLARALGAEAPVALVAKAPVAEVERERVPTFRRPRREATA